MPTFAAATTVSSETSRAEIERTLARYGADSFAYGWEGERAMVGFKMQGRFVRFLLPLPAREDFALTEARRKRRAPAAQEAAYEQAVKQRWRALALVVKAKLEAVESEIVTFDEEFAMHFVLPNGTTFGQWAGPQIERAYATGDMPRALPMLTA